MPDSPQLARMKARKADLEAKLARLGKMTETDQPGLDQSKKFTTNGIAMLDTEIKRLSTLNSQLST